MFDLRFAPRRLQRKEQEPEPQFPPPQRPWIEPRELYNPDGVIGQVYSQLPPGTRLPVPISYDHPAAIGPVEGYPDPMGMNDEPVNDFLRSMFMRDYERDYNHLQPPGTTADPGIPQTQRTTSYQQMLRMLALRGLMRRQQFASPLS